MAQEKQETSKEQMKEGNKKAENALLRCTTAPSAEHARGYNEDEPCDDGRAGE